MQIVGDSPLSHIRATSQTMTPEIKEIVRNYQDDKVERTVEAGTVPAHQQIQECRTWMQGYQSFHEQNAMVDKAIVNSMDKSRSGISTAVRDVPAKFTAKTVDTTGCTINPLPMQAVHPPSLKLTHPPQTIPNTGLNGYDESFLSKVTVAGGGDNGMPRSYGNYPLNYAKEVANFQQGLHQSIKSLTSRRYNYSGPNQANWLKQDVANRGVDGPSGEASTRSPHVEQPSFNRPDDVVSDRMTFGGLRYASDSENTAVSKCGFSHYGVPALGYWNGLVKQAFIAKEFLRFSAKSYEISRNVPSLQGPGTNNLQSPTNPSVSGYSRGHRDSDHGSLQLLPHPHHPLTVPIVDNKGGIANVANTKQVAVAKEQDTLTSPEKIVGISLASQALTSDDAGPVSLLKAKHMMAVKIKVDDKFKKMTCADAKNIFRQRRFLSKGLPIKILAHGVEIIDGAMLWPLVGSGFEVFEVEIDWA